MNGTVNGSNKQYLIEIVIMYIMALQFPCDTFHQRMLFFQNVSS